ncbi:3-deoxy-D-manno-octulosonic acid transferase [Ectothiorhodospiraceae bacterium 2226]|nr:3-deoxy-D-manno-octulosonic acid transferase [Ectothiorhodospiraceae bacterium 2226]
MSLLDLLGLHRFPAAARGATLVVADSATLAHARGLLQALTERLGPLAVALADAGEAPAQLPWPVLRLPAQGVGRWHRRLAAPRVIALGACAGRPDVLEGADACSWVNAQTNHAALAGCRLVTVADAQAAERIPGAKLTGDPLVELTGLPAAAVDEALCERFRDQRAAGRWVGYFAATGEDEEPVAYGSFFQLARRKMGLLVLAPADPARYEPVYREAIKYRLPTNRHNRLSTSYVPIKTRVYYVEDAEVMAGLYGCADYVVVGGTVSEAARNAPDVLTPLALGRATIVGPARHDALIGAAVRAGAVAAATTPEEMVDHAAAWILDPAAAQAQGERGRAWLHAQVGARERVLALLN